VLRHLGGPTFQAKWGDGRHTLDDLYYVVRTSMPYSEPGKLSRQQYMDVIAYVLNMNGYQEGEQELVPNTIALKAITIRGH
jgi:S-disulfanyl-L-cysteine oxidoreductase SoxD